MDKKFRSLAKELKGELKWDPLHLRLYATDASVYRMLPWAIAYPRDEEDLCRIARFCHTHTVPVIPRAAGTSLAGQCVGEGLVVDTSRHMRAILDLDTKNRTVTVQPGVIRDELNAFLAPHGLYFGPNTSTSNRCMIGGMVGNNSSGTTSIRYGVTRDKVYAVRAVLADGSLANFCDIDRERLPSLIEQGNLEGSIYRLLAKELACPEVQEEIRRHFPGKGIHRRNTGYAVESLLDCSPFTEGGPNLNLGKLLCGSEGTLAFTSQVTLKLDPLPPGERVMVVVHYSGMKECLEDVLVAMDHPLYTCELMDDTILNCTRNNRKFDSYRFFIQGTPRALLMLELRDQSKVSLEEAVGKLLNDLKRSGRSYAQVLLREREIEKALELRKAGLGLLGNMVGDSKAVACIEDTAVALEDLPVYISEFEALMEKFGQKAVYYAHAGAGELHLRPILNLKQVQGVALFREITAQVAELVKRYGGSLSGEHGDGIVRGEFLPQMIGKENYRLLERIKDTFDPRGILNPGKIVRAWKMDHNLRYEPGRDEPAIPTFYDFTAQQGVLRLVESCNGSGDCRKPAGGGAAMCPSYQATLDEKDSTRGRANVLREILTNNTAPNAFDSEEIKEVLDLCLSCKACSSECPSNVDIASVKSEFLHQYRSVHGDKLRDRVLGQSSRLNKLAATFPGLANFLFRQPLSSGIIKRFAGIATQRSLPLVSSKASQRRIHRTNNQAVTQKKKLILLVDELSRYLDAGIAADTRELLEGLGYSVEVIDGLDSARALISKGYLERARDAVDHCINTLSGIVDEQHPLVGIEPSAILGFRDEFPRLASDKKAAKRLKEHTFLLEEFIVDQARAGNIRPEQFTKAAQEVKIHVHCHQKSLSDSKTVFDALNLPTNYRPTLIPSGCCGMAGSFGFEKEHYALSMQIGGMTLFPSVRKAGQGAVIAASGTSCRHQILDGTGVRAKHSATILKEALL